MLRELQERIERRVAKIAIVGLGYVGLPVATSFAAAGFGVTGVDIQEKRILQINEGISPINGDEPGLAELLSSVVAEKRLVATTDYNDIADADVILINVETPVDADHRPRYDALKSATGLIGQVMKPGALIVIESTIAPGTMDGVIKPLLEKSSGKQLNAGFYLGHCPERVMPGKLLANLSNMSRVCGGSSPRVADVMIMLYRTVVQADLDSTDCITAELVKTSENAYRDVNIAFANELALICEANGADFKSVRALVNKSPDRHVLLAGAGVGGHCIPKDPWLMVSGLSDKIPIRLIPAARAVNDYMPKHIAKLICEGLERYNVRVSGARVAIFGYAYLENSDDTRNSPSAVLVKELSELEMNVSIYDPYIATYAENWPDVVVDADAAVFMVAHDEFRAMSLNDLARYLSTPLLIDGRHLFDAQQANFANLTYIGVGDGLRQEIM